jgi:hypothetical protein
MSRLQQICNLVREQLVIIKDIWEAPGPNRKVQLSNSWDEFIESQMKKMLNGANAFAIQWLKRLEDVYELRHDTDPDKGFVLLRVKVLEVHRIDMLQTGLYVGGYP